MKFDFSDLGELENYCEKNGYKIHFDPDTKILSSPLHINKREFNNRFCVHPMEGSDADENGAVTDLVTA
ncbi:MAG TPA: hypothetical protein P5127_02380, partial [Oscillospiraceae bacterium]|nr:hypothetical protein [Oscillospiraceae bacterium]